jgi:hypothetical protein
MRKLFAAVAVLAAAATLVGCGGDDDGGGLVSPAISKAEFIAQANQICRAGSAELARVSLDPDTSPEELQQIVVATVIPNIRKQVADIRALGFPAGEEAKLDGVFDQVEQILDQARANPAGMLDESTDEFAEVNQQLTAYGLDTCGES